MYGLKNLLQEEEKRLRAMKIEIEAVYKQSHPLKQQFIQPIEPTWEQKISEFRNMKYKGKMFGAGDIDIII